LGSGNRNHFRELLIDLLSLSPALLLLLAVAFQWTFPRWAVLGPPAVLGITMWRLNGESWLAIATWLIPIELLIAVAAFFLPLPWSLAPLCLAAAFLVVMIFSQRAIRWWHVRVIERIGD